MKQINSGSPLKQACLQGLSKEAKKWAENQIKTFETFDEKEIPYSLIRKIAIKTHHLNK